MTAIAPQDPESLGEIGKELLDDVNGKKFAEYRDYFEQALFKARSKLQQPLSKEQAEMNQAMADCTGAAVNVITSVWNAMHQGK